MPEACLNVVLTLEWYCVPVYQVSKSGTLVIGINKFVVYKLVNVVLTLGCQVSKSGTLTQPSYRHYCLRLFVVVYKLVNVVLTSEWYCVPVYQVS